MLTSNSLKKSTEQVGTLIRVPFGLGAQQGAQMIAMVILWQANKD